MKLAMDDERVVGCLGYMPTEVVVCGKPLRGAWLANWMVAPEHARLGLGPLLLREVLREVDAVVNVGISDDARALLARMGWLDLGLLSRWVRALNASGADALLAPEARGQWPAAVGDPAPDEFDIRQVQEFGEESTALWDELWGAHHAGTRRSAALLNWRYAAHPTFRYELLELRQANALAGFGVYRLEHVADPNARVGRIVELVARPVAAAPLIAAVCAHAAAREVVMLDFFCSSRRLDADLQAQGFQPGDSGRAAFMPYLFQPIDRRRPGIACMIHAANIDALPERDDWYATKGDADQDRPN